MVKLSIWEDARREIDNYKWIASERAGCDLGEAAILSWIGNHWTGYLRARWIEHLQGKTFWIELDGGDFGFMQTSFQERKAILLDRICDRLKVGQENLHIFLWALDWHIPMNDVFQVLDSLDINGKRLIHQLERAGNSNLPTN